MRRVSLIGTLSLLSYLNHIVPHDITLLRLLK